MPKQLQTEYGPVEIETPRDRDGSFEPETVKKHQRSEYAADQRLHRGELWQQALRGNSAPFPPLRNLKRNLLIDALYHTRRDKLLLIGIVLTTVNDRFFLVIFYFPSLMNRVFSARIISSRMMLAHHEGLAAQGYPCIAHWSMPVFSCLPIIVFYLI